MTTEACAKVQAAVNDYWAVQNSEIRSLQFRWLELHLESCQECSDFTEDVIEKMNLKPPGSDGESC